MLGPTHEGGQAPGETTHWVFQVIYCDVSHRWPWSWRRETIKTLALPQVSKREANPFLPFLCSLPSMCPFRGNQFVCLHSHTSSVLDPRNPSPFESISYS